MNNQTMTNFFGTLEVVAWRGATEAARILGCDIFPKVKYSDVIEVRKSGISDEDFDYAIRAHFDCVAVRNNSVLFAVEIDASTPGQTQRHNMERKQRLCQNFGFPLLYINAVGTDKRLLADYISKRILDWYKSRKWLSDEAAS